MKIRTIQHYKHNWHSGMMNRLSNGSTDRKIGDVYIHPTHPRTRDP